MQIGILGAGLVGEAIGTVLIKKGHKVKLGAPDMVDDIAASWVDMNGENASRGTFTDAAVFGELLFICLNGHEAKDALMLAGPDAFAGKVVIDLTSPLDFSRGMPPVLVPSLSNTTSLGEQIQAYLPAAKVVKTLITVSAELMVDATKVNGGDSDLLICGNDEGAKEQVKTFLAERFGWRRDNMIDLGDITAARNMEAYVPLWVRIWQSVGTPMFNIKIVR